MDCEPNLSVKKKHILGHLPELIKIHSKHFGNNLLFFTDKPTSIINNYYLGYIVLLMNESTLNSGQLFFDEQVSYSELNRS